MHHLRRLRILVSLILSGNLLGSCAGPTAKTPVPPTLAETEETPTLTLSLPTLTATLELPTPTPRPPTLSPTVDQIASNSQMLAYIFVPGEDPEPRDRLAEIYTVRADGSHRTRLLSEKEMMIGGLASSPDGKQIAFWGCPGDILTDCYPNGDADILVIDWQGGDVRHLTGSPGHERDPDWSPDGRIAFLSDRSGSEQIYIMNSDGSDPRRLTDHPIQNTHPKWSPDGRWIAYQNSLEFKSRIYVISPDGEPAGESIPGYSPVWSPATLPGGLRLAFVCFQQDGSTDICTARPDGSDQVNLTHTPFDEHAPAWSPDGNWLVYEAGTGAERIVSKVCMICPGGAEAVRLTGESVPHGVPMWSPDGQRVAIRSLEGLFLVNADGSGGIQLVEGLYFNPVWRP